MVRDNNKSGQVSKRSLLTHLAAVASGWAVGSFLDTFRRGINSLIAHTRFGRRAKVGFGYTPIENLEEGPITSGMEGKGYRLRIHNSGNETAENISIHLGFEEKIIAVQTPDWTNIPPAPDFNADVIDGGMAKIRIDFLRRGPQNHDNSLRLYFSVDEETQSNAAFRIDKEEGIFVAYRYSWTFLGERYYESTKHHVVRKN